MDQSMLVPHHAYSRHGPGFSVVLLLSLCCALGCSGVQRAGCAQRDSAEPVKQSGVREGQRCRRSLLFMFFIPASALVSRREHGIEAAVAFSHQLPTTRREPSVFARDTGTESLREKPELMSLDSHNKPDKDDTFMGVVHALRRKVEVDRAIINQH